MLSTEKIGLLIADPSRIQLEELVELDALTKQYPYSSIFSMLYLIGLKKVKSVKFDEELKLHSYRISDRSRLYYLIEGSEVLAINQEEKTAVLEEHNVSAETNEETETSISTQTTSQDKEETTVNADIPFIPQLEEASNEAKISELDANEKVAEASEIPVVERIEEEPYFDYEFSIGELDGLEFIQLEDENITNEETIIDDEEIEFHADATEEIDTTIPSNLQTENDLLEENIQHHIISSGYHLEALNEAEAKALEERQSENARIEEKTAETVEEVEVETDEEKVSPTSFTGWLHADSNFIAQPIQDPELSKTNVNSFSTFDPFEELSGTIERPKTEFFSPSKKAKESLDESKLPVSETLAKIFVLQGNYPKAIQVYEQLMLNFPEKKVFFANSIAQIKEKLNSIE